VAIQDGILYASDLSGFLYALDARTGQLYWTHDLLAAVWGSPFVPTGGSTWATRTATWRS
jgi:outer membrane protein assembly factor BamB